MCVHSQSPCGLQIRRQCLSKVLWTLPHWQLYEVTHGQCQRLQSGVSACFAFMQIHVCRQFACSLKKSWASMSWWTACTLQTGASHFLWWWGISSLIKSIKYVQVRSPLLCHRISVSTEEELMRFDFKANLVMEHLDQFLLLEWLDCLGAYKHSFNSLEQINLLRERYSLCVCFMMKLRINKLRNTQLDSKKSFHRWLP